jgi:large subunit ribosomal protein L32e
MTSKASPSGAPRGLLKLRRTIRKKRPQFKRQEQDFEKTLSRSWRHPRGRKSEMRRHKKSRGAMPHPGYGSPKSVRGLDRLGRRQVRVFAPAEVDGLDPAAHSLVIGGSVGRKKSLEIRRKAMERGIRIAN